MIDFEKQAETLLATWCDMSGATDDPTDPIRPDFLTLIAKGMADARRAAIEECIAEADGEAQYCVRQRDEQHDGSPAWLAEGARAAGARSIAGKLRALIDGKVVP